MKKHDLQPTDDNIRSTFYNDSIGRNKDLVNFIKIIDSIDESYSIALDSYWGSGKTFFVKQVKMILDANNEFTYDSVKEKEKVIQIWKNWLKEDIINTNYHIPIYYDAWSNDNDNDPILSIIYQIIQTVGNHATIEEQIGLSSVINLAGDIFELVKGFNPLEIAKKLKCENPLEEIMQTKSLKERIDEFFENLIPEHGERLLIIIDELDRCNPEFAVKLLESIKHYFNNDKVTFVFSVNLAELQHTVKHHYGDEFNAQRYLDRFFDLTIKLPRPNMQAVFDNHSIKNSVIQAAIDFFNIQLREMPKYIRVYNKIDYNELENQGHIDCSCTSLADSDTGISIAVMSLIHVVIIPYLLALKITDESGYNDFFNGQGEEKFESFVMSLPDEIHEEIDYLMGNKSEFEQRLKDFYDKLIHYYPRPIKDGVQPFDQVGNCVISGREKHYLRNSIEDALQNMEEEE